MNTFVESRTCGSGCKGLGLDAGVGNGNGMVAGKGRECTHGPALVARVYYGGPVLTVIGSDEPFETSDREIGRGGGGPVPAIWQQQQY